MTGMIAMESGEALRIREWMRSVMEEKDWSAERWARLADTSPTNITRFMDNSKHVPSARTIAKLARVAGSQPSLIGPAKLTTVNYIRGYNELYWLILMAEPERADFMITYLGEVSQKAFGWRLPDPAPHPEFRAGDVLICEEAAVLAPRDGDWVVYGDQGEPSVGRWVNGAVLTGRGDVLRAKALAVVVSLQRPMR